MVQTITSILDGSADHNNTLSTEQQDSSISRHEFDMAMVTCFRSCLELTIDESKLVVTRMTLDEMIRWSQRKDVLSLDVYRLLLQYMNACLHRALGDDEHFHLQCHQALRAKREQI